jgi:CcmD family protein
MMISRLFVPDTTNYMIAGYLVISVMVIGYVISLILRWRKLAKEHFQRSIENRN